MSTFRAFQTGLMAGQQQAKVKREDDARVKAAEAFGSGNYEGAVSSLMGVGLMDDANAYGQAGERRKEADRTKAYADAFKTGLGAGPKQDRRAGYLAVANIAAQQGDFATMESAYQAVDGLDDRQKAQVAEGMEFLSSTALGLKGVPPEARGQAAMEILQASPYGNPQILAQIQQAAADGLITDEELDNFAMQTMSVAERVKASKPQLFNTGQSVVAVSPGSDPKAEVLYTDPQKAAAGRQPPSGYTWTEEGALAPIPGGPADPKRSGVDVDPKIIALETTLSSKWMPIQNNFQDIANQFGRINTLAKNKNSASDLGLIVSFTKMLDPGSVAREGEVALTQSAQSLYEQAAMWAPRLAGGKTLLPDSVRKMYVDAARDMFGQYEKTYQRLAQSTQKRAADYGLSPDRIMLGYEAPAPAGKTASTPAMQMGIRAYAAHSGLPAEAITEFLSNPATPQEIAEFNEAFGEGAAEAILKAMQGGR
ncbi:MAG: hypothetical protein RIR33_3717 [Pseudomonadota bacterium]|jgi:hypothetical protein